jgi:hypothetical protein
MNAFDPLDWLHQWDDFEMIMYARDPSEQDDGIFMQVSRKTARSGVEEWQILYDRKIADLPVDQRYDGAEIERDRWEEQVLRHHLNEHPELVSDEKLYLQRFLETRSE